MVKKISIALLVIFIASCNKTASIKLENFIYVNKYRRNNIDESLAGFSKLSENENSNDYADVLDYNIATVYLKKGESAIAAEKFLVLEQSDEKLVVENSYYQLGLIYFQEGNYQEAAEYFKKSLQINSTAIDAKINYEIALQMIEVNSKPRLNESQGAALDEQIESDTTKSIFNLIRQKEAIEWSKKNLPKQNTAAYDY